MRIGKLLQTASGLSFHGLDFTVTFLPDGLLSVMGYPISMTLSDYCYGSCCHLKKNITDEFRVSCKSRGKMKGSKKEQNQCER